MIANLEIEQQIRKDQDFLTFWIDFFFFGTLLNFEGIVLYGLKCAKKSSKLSKVSKAFLIQAYFRRYIDLSK